MRNAQKVLVSVVVCLVGLFLVSSCAHGPACLAKARTLDLTHTLQEGLPLFPGSPPFDVQKVADYDQGYYANKISMIEHTGTHVDSPAHFTPGTDTIDEVPLQRLIGPAVVVDVKGQVQADPDYRLTVDDLRRWESAYRRIPNNAIVIMYTRWGSRWTENDRYVNMDENHVMRFPGYSAEAAKFLVEDRDIAGIGIDTLSLDYGPSRDFAVHHIVCGAGKFMIENLANLESLPPEGATLVVAPLKIRDGSGAPARIFAILP